MDGFRCDVAPLVPLEFWQEARSRVAEVNPECIWLSESVEPGYILENRFHNRICLSDAEIYQAFDVAYDYDIYCDFIGYLRGENSLQQYVDKINMQEYIYPDNYVKLRFLENHDQERIRAFIPDRGIRRNWTAFLYFQKGMTLLYAGQEMENISRPDLFNKDNIEWNTGSDISDFLSSLYKIKKQKILADGEYHVEIIDDVVLHARYRTRDDQLDGYFSLTGKTETFRCGRKDGSYRNQIDDSRIQVQGGLVTEADLPIIM